jgi:hypothetical protein
VAPLGAAGTEPFDDQAFDKWLSIKGFDTTNLGPEALAQLRNAFLLDQRSSQ